MIPAAPAATAPAGREYQIRAAGQCVLLALVDFRLVWNNRKKTKKKEESTKGHEEQRRATKALEKAQEGWGKGRQGGQRRTQGTKRICPRRSNRDCSGASGAHFPPHR